MSLQRKHIPIIAIVCGVMWAGVFPYVFGAQSEGSSLAYLFALLPAAFVTNVLWRFWDEVLAQRDAWSDERNLAYMRASGAFQTLRGLAGPVGGIAFALWLFRFFPACRIASVILFAGFIAYRVLMPVYLLRRIGTENTDG